MANDNSSLGKIQRGLEGSEGAVVKDAAGNMIGEVKAQVVRDRMGHIIGEVGPAPEAPGPGARELIQQGLEKQVTDAEKAMVPIIETMTAHARAVRTLKDRVSQFDFKARQEAKVKAEELKAKYEEGEKQLHELRKKAGMYSQHTPFLKDVDAHLVNMKRHFTEEIPFVLNRF